MNAIFANQLVNKVINRGPWSIKIHDFTTEPEFTQLIYLSNRARVWTEKKITKYPFSFCTEQ